MGREKARKLGEVGRMELDIKKISRDLGFDIDEYLEVLDVFLENTPLVIQKFKACLSENNLEEAAEHCHLIKGGASSIGLDEISSVAHNIEKACKNGNVSTVTELLGELSALVTMLEEKRQLV